MSQTLTRLFAVACAALALNAAHTAAFADSEPTVFEYSEIPLYSQGTYMGAAYLMGATAYVPLRAFCETAAEANFDAVWNPEECSVCLSSESIEISLVLQDSYMAANGRYILLSAPALNINGTVMLPIRDIARVFDVEIAFDAESWTIDMDTTAVEIIQSGEKFYDEATLYWLSRAIYSEAGAEPFDGMIGVGNVIMNRLASGAYESVYEVVFSPGQFSVVDTGAIFADPSPDAILAAKLVMEGCNTVGSALYFANPSICDVSWFNCNFTFVGVIGNHAFYA